MSSCFIRQETAEKVHKEIKERRVDFGFVESRRDDGLQYLMLRDGKLVLVTGKESKFVKNDAPPVNLSEISGEPIVLWDCALSAGKHIIKRISDAGGSVRPENPVAVLDSIDAVKQYVSNGFGNCNPS